VCTHVTGLTDRPPPRLLPRKSRNRRKSSSGSGSKQQRPVASQHAVISRIKSPLLQACRPRAGLKVSPALHRRRTSALPTVGTCEAVAAAATPTHLSFNAGPERCKVQNSYNDALPAPNLKLLAKGEAAAAAAQIAEVSPMRGVEPCKMLSMAMGPAPLVKERIPLHVPPPPLLSTALLLCFVSRCRCRYVMRVRMDSCLIPHSVASPCLATPYNPAPAAAGAAKRVTSPFST